MDLEQQALALLSTVVWFAIALALFGVSIRLMDMLTPFSLRKEIEEDQNVSLGIVIGAALIGLAMILAAVIRS